MENNYDEIEEELKKNQLGRKAKHHINGKSVFKLQEIIVSKHKDSDQNKEEDDRSLGKRLPDSN